MPGVYRDKDYPDLVWMDFSGPTWEEFHELLAELEAFNSVADAPYYLAFNPSVDMPRGAPLAHIRRLMSFLNHEKKIVGIIAVVPRQMIFAKAFSDIATRLFPGSKPTSIVTNRDDIYSEYSKLAAKS